MPAGTAAVRGGGRRRLPTASAARCPPCSGGPEPDGRAAGCRAPIRAALRGPERHPSVQRSWEAWHRCHRVGLPTGPGELQSGVPRAEQGGRGWSGALTGPWEGQHESQPCRRAVHRVPSSWCCHCSCLAPSTAEQQLLVSWACSLGCSHTGIVILVDPGMVGNSGAFCCRRREL